MENEYEFFLHKYLEYKQKYFELEQQLGGKKKCVNNIHYVS